MRVGMGLTRDQEIDYAIERGIEIPITKSSPYSIDANLWGRSFETGVLEDPWVTPPDDAYAWTVEAGRRARRRSSIVIGFEGGIPVSIDGEPLRRLELVQRLHDLGGAHGVGRIDHVEDRLVGIKSREIYEAPAAAILHTRPSRARGARRCRKDTLRFNRPVADELAQLIYDGLWFSALPRDLRGVRRVARSGSCRARSGCGSTTAPRTSSGRRSPLVAVRQEPRDVRRGRRVRPRGAVGFIEIFGLPLRVEAARHGAVGKRHGAAWTWTEPLLDGLPTTVAEAAGAAAG